MKKWIILIVLSGTICYANELPEGVQVESINDFSFGMNTTQDESKLTNNMASYMQNGYIDEKYGSFVKRKGFVVSGSTSGLIDVRFMGIFNRESADKEYLISDSSSVYSTKDFTDYKLLRRGLNKNLNISGEQVRNKYWFTNGSDSVFTYDGSTVVVLDGGTYSGTVTPNVPKGKYIKYYQERVFVYNESGNNSRCDYSALVDTNSLIIAPDDSRAWSVTTNNLQIGQGDGESGTSMWIYRNQLRFGKEHSIYTLFGDSQFTYNPVKTEAKVGVVSNDSVVILDGLTYFLGQDGIYEFNGSESRRISDFIQSDIDLVKKDVSRVVVNTWDSQSEFSKGSFSGSTVTAEGFVQMFSSYQVTILANIDKSEGGSEYHFRGNSTSTPYIILSTNAFTSQLDSNFLGYMAEYPNGVTTHPNGAALRIVHKASETAAVGGCSYSTRVIVKNLRTNSTGYYSSEIASNQFQTGDFLATAFPSHVLFTGDDVRLSSLAIKIEFENFSCSGSTIGAFPVIKTATTTGSFHLQPSATVQFISEITTITTLNSWGIFESIRNTNGGSISYFYRTSTSVVNIATQTFIAISPGSIIGSTGTQNFIQWASTIASVSTDSNKSNIDKVTIDHIEGGGSNTRAFGIGYRGRYNLFVSTVSDGSITRNFVKSKVTNQNPNAWMNMTGMNFRSVLLDGSNVYGGSASSGSVNRWDFGTNDNGQAIDAVYETGILSMGNRFFVKNVQEYLIDVNKETGANLTIGTSTDTFNFNNVNVNIDGSGSLLKSIKGIATNSKQYKFRFRNNELDKGLTLNRFDIIYQPTQIR